MLASADGAALDGAWGWNGPTSAWSPLSSTAFQADVEQIKNKSVDIELVDLPETRFHRQAGAEGMRILANVPHPGPFRQDSSAPDPEIAEAYRWHWIRSMRNRR